jgi:hypothetical protein
MAQTFFEGIQNVLREDLSRSTKHAHIPD